MVRKFTLTIGNRTVEVTVDPMHKFPYQYEDQDHEGNTVNHKYSSFLNMMMLGIDPTHFKFWSKGTP